jgi:hypothetical protein
MLAAADRARGFGLRAPDLPDTRLAARQDADLVGLWGSTTARLTQQWLARAWIRNKRRFVPSVLVRRYCSGRAAVANDIPAIRSAYHRR